MSFLGVQNLGQRTSKGNGKVLYLASPYIQREAHHLVELWIAEEICTTFSFSDMIHLLRKLSKLVALSEAWSKTNKALAVHSGFCASSSKLGNYGSVEPTVLKS